MRFRHSGKLGNRVCFFFPPEFRRGRAIAANGCIRRKTEPRADICRVGHHPNGMRRQVDCICQFPPDFCKPPAISFVGVGGNIRHKFGFVLRKSRCIKRRIEFHRADGAERGRGLIQSVQRINTAFSIFFPQPDRPLDGGCMFAEIGSDGQGHQLREKFPRERLQRFKQQLPPLPQKFLGDGVFPHRQ